MSHSRRSFFKIAGAAAVAGAGAKAAEAKEIASKIEGAEKFTSVCTFCSCGCGLVGYVKDGKLVHLDGDPDHIVNEGALCSKGASLGAVPNSEMRVKTPLYRAPGSDRWQTISWDEALAKVAQKIKAARDANWIATEKDGDREVPVNRTDAIGFLGGGQNTNEECYLMAKMGRLVGTPYIEHQARL